MRSVTMRTDATHNQGESMKIAVTAIAVAGLFAAGAVQADGGESLLKKSGCMSCHSIDKKNVGPSYNDVSAKYKGDAGAGAKLMVKVKKGGGGVWGTTVLMPPNPQVNDADLKTMIDYILALKK